MTRYQQKAQRLKWVILVAGSISFLTGLFWTLGPYFNMGKFLGVEWITGTYMTPISPIMSTFFGVTNPLHLPDWAPYLLYSFDLLLFWGLFLLLQWCFLQPGKRWAVRQAKWGRPLKKAIWTAAFMSMLISAGILFALFDATGIFPVIFKFTPDGDPQYWFYMLICWCIMLTIWFIWAWIFFRYWKDGDHVTQMGRIVRGLIAGTILETFIGTAVFIWNPQKEDCYCARGSYFSLIFGGTVLLWCFGPGLVLLFMREKYRRYRTNVAGHPLCANCNYDLSGSITANKTACPECGCEMPKSPDGYDPHTD
ncbi:hypothetical protein [Poriferisphaera sp. WC338]|uniref:hypothetical protein n=1 Tax=Poriferisphaera sp. WC338 TaxID=3425129 RepID=UPI003D817BAC